MTLFRNHAAAGRALAPRAAQHARHWGTIAATALSLMAGGAQAADSSSNTIPAMPGGWSVGLFGAKAVNNDLLEIIPKAFSGDLDLQRAYLGGVVVRRALPTPQWFADFGRWADMPVGTSIEVNLLKGRGVVDNTEFVVDWRPAIRPWQLGPLTLEFAWGLGYSHSFGKPWTDYTDPDHPNGYHDLFHMSPEVVFIPTEAPDWSLGLRVHHRSGIYGLVAPRRVGSNHLALELVHSF